MNTSANTILFFVLLTRLDQPSSTEGERFADELLAGSINGTYEDRHVEYEGYDGWYNNFARPDSGAIGKSKQT